MKIPGFRTNRLWKKIIAIIGYLAMFFIIIAILSDDYAIYQHDKYISLINGIIIVTFLIVIPFILITNFAELRKKLPMFKSKKILIRFLGCIVYSLILITTCSFLSLKVERYYSKEYLNSKVIAESEKEKLVANNNSTKETNKQSTNTTKKTEVSPKQKDEVSTNNKNLFSKIYNIISSFNFKDDSDKPTSTNLNKAIIKTTLNTTISTSDSFALPTTIVAKLNNKNITLPVSWDKASIDTTNPGSITATGIVSGYPNKIIYTINIIPSIYASSFSNISTHSSSIIYKKPVNSSWVMFHIIKDNEEERQYCPTSNEGALDYTLYLHFGQGIYNISVYSSVTNDKYGYYNLITTYQINNKDTRDMRYLLPSEYVQSNNTEIVKLANDITKDCFSDTERTKAIHDWVSKNISYDIEAYNTKVKENSALETLHNKKAVCNGYANLTAALNRAIGIKAQICSGTAQAEGISGSHAWNSTFAEGKWILQDTTWDAGGIDSSGNFKQHFRTTYFTSDINNFEKSHTKTSDIDH